MKLLLLIFVAILFTFFVSCTDATGPEDSKPALSNLKLPENVTLTCYPFKSRLTTRDDSITISFDYNNKRASTISITGSIDSGKTWFFIKQLTPTSVNHADAIWSPKDTINAMFKFCDEKKCVVRVATTSDTLTSNEFYIIGSEPAVLIKPKKGDHYHISDSLPVQYNCNMDLLSDITVWFYTNNVGDREEFSEDSSRVIKTEGVNFNLKKLTYIFPLLRYSDKLPKTTSPVSILISDYLSSGFFQIVDSIIIEMP